jgi:hypothetical protein
VVEKDWPALQLVLIRAMSMDRFIDAMRFQRRIQRLGEAGFFETYYLGSSDPEKVFKIFHRVILHNRIMLVIQKYFRAAGFGDIAGDKHEMQPRFAPRQGVASYYQNAGAKDKRK